MYRKIWFSLVQFIGAMPPPKPTEAIPLAMALSLAAACLVFPGTATAQLLGGREEPNEDPEQSEKSELSRLFEEYDNSIQFEAPRDEWSFLQGDESPALPANNGEEDTASFGAWDFHKSLKRLATGDLDYDLFDGGFFARPYVITDRSRGFNQPISAQGPDFAGKPGKLRPSANITVEIQADSASFHQDANNIATVGEIPDGAFFRRSRLGVYGELYKTVEYRLEYDFANEARPQFLDKWVALTNMPVIKNVIIGHYFEPFSLERYSPNRFVTFMERSLADTFVPARNMGAMVYGNALDQRLTFAVGAFRSNSDLYGSDVSYNTGLAGTVHATYLAWYEEIGEDNLKLLHLGGSYSYRSTGDDPVNFSTRPSVRMRQQDVGGVPIFVNTGDLDDASHLQLYGLEAAWVHKTFSMQSEFIAAEVHRNRNTDPVFHGGYIYGSWFLTGESRSYSPVSALGRFREGIFQRTIPRSNVFNPNAGIGWTGGGAIELAVRWSYIDLNSSGVRGGYLEELTYGINWYLNPYTKAMFNYVRPRLTDPIFGKSKSDSLAMRVQFEF